MTARNRKRLHGLPPDVARRIDEAILDLADGLAEGVALPHIGGFRYRTARGDVIVYDVDAKALYVDDFVAVE